MTESPGSTELALISVISDVHAAEPRDGILRRKADDIKQFGRTFWFNRSSAIDVASLANAGPLPVYFVSPAQDKIRDEDEDEFDTCTEYSHNGTLWHRLPENLSPVTGTRRGNYFAIVMDKLEICIGSPEFDLWDYSNLDGTGLKFNQSVPTVCARKQFAMGMKKHQRRLIAVGRLCCPGLCYLR
jgi:hypothetical protein